jgi:hypothetical protein
MYCSHCRAAFRYAKFLKSDIFAALGKKDVMMIGKSNTTKKIVTSTIVIVIING